MLQTTRKYMWSIQMFCQNIEMRAAERKDRDKLEGKPVHE